MTLNKQIPWILMVMAILVGVRCTEPTAADQSLVNVLLIDAPGDFDQVWIEILGVEILPSGGRGANNSNWVNIPYLSPNKSVLVSDLVADERLLLGRTEIQTGTLSKIRLLLGDSHYVVRDNIQIPLMPTPSMEGLLELEVDFQTAGGISYDVYLDFNLALSIVETSNGTFQLKPSLSSFVLQETADISGVLTPNLIKPYVYAISEADTFATLTNNTGSFRLRGLPPGDYQVLVEAPTGLLDTAFMVSMKADTLVQLPNIILRPDIPF
ncbi:MAG: DUF4382 domain-containing protein [Cyclobacteriaceae bacterium]